MKFVLVFFFSSIVLCAESKSIQLSYTFEKRDSNSIKVVVVFQGKKSGHTKFFLPNEWAGEKQLYNCIQDLHALSANTTLISTDHPYEYNVNHGPSATISISYILVPDWSGKLRYPFYRRPVINDDYFYFDGYAGLAYPDINQEEKLSCQIKFIGYSPHDFIATSFFSGKTENRFSSSLGNVLNAVFAGGKFRSAQLTDRSTKIIIAVTGNFKFDDSELFKSISRLVISERNFWNDHHEPYFLVIVLPLTDPATSGGTAHYRSFALYHSNSLPMDRGLTYLISHEYFHNWIGQRLKMSKPEETYKWFQEGFTDYYAYKILYADDSQKFTQQMNKILNEYYLSPYFNLPNKELIGKFWDNPEMKQLSYQRGAVIAFLIDNAIQKNSSKSLDNLMMDLYTLSKPKRVFSMELFNSIASRYLDTALVSLVTNINNGNNQQLTNAIQANSIYTIKILTPKKFELGFNLISSKEKMQIVGLKPNSNASASGLKEGMLITGRFSIYNDDVEKPAKVEVMVNNEKKVISYIPSAITSIEVPQIVQN
ncbi:MAG: putative metalloprotease, contains C-terminal domain [Chitinophagaceae bacterium]|nr:putative metalloprotease, contains C-terminal domain [Chitinophagaceae bacterium]